MDDLKYLIEALRGTRTPKDKRQPATVRRNVDTGEIEYDPYRGAVGETPAVPYPTGLRKKQLDAWEKKAGL